LRERVTAKDIDVALHGLAAKGCVSLYTVGGKPYFSFPTWAEHQRIRDVKPKYPAPEEADEFDNLPQIAASCGELRLESNPIQSESNTNPNPNPNFADAGSASVKNDLFDRFWSAYPKKIGKGAAQKAFEKAHIGKDLIETVLKAIDQQKNTDQWKKDGGQYIPNPATWLNQQRWEDEVTVKPNNPKPSYDMDIISQRFALGNIK
jgi:hypothetical protein